jgi:hypothetical protein
MNLMNQATITLPSGEEKTFRDLVGLDLINGLVIQGCRQDLYNSLAQFLPAICTGCNKLKPVAAIHADYFSNERKPTCKVCDIIIEELRR